MRLAVPDPRIVEEDNRLVVRVPRLVDDDKRLVVPVPRIVDDVGMDGTVLSRDVVPGTPGVVGIDRVVGSGCPGCVTVVVRIDVRPGCVIVWVRVMVCPGPTPPPPTVTEVVTVTVQ